MVAKTRDLTDKLIKTHHFVFNKQDNGGEALSLTTKFFHNGDEGDKGIYPNQELALQSYCNSASFHLSGTSIDSNMLRKLADELDRATIEAQALKVKMDQEIP